MTSVRRLPAIIRLSRRNLFGLGTVRRKQKIMSYSETRLIGFTTEQMFDVVYTVAEYPQFVPWCKRADIRKISNCVFEAELYIGFPPLNEQYTSRVTALHPYVVRSVCTDGNIFNLMETIWCFGPPKAGYPLNSCSLDFKLNFQFKSILHAHLAQAFFGQVVRKMVCAFLRRAEHLYGPPSFNHFATKVLIKLPEK